MLQNAYFLAKISADTAENKQCFAEILPKSASPAAAARTATAAVHLRTSTLCGLSDYVNWVANKRFEISKFKFKFPRARTYELFRARSLLYRSQILQVNTRWKALAEIYTMHSFAPFSNLKLLLKIAEICADFYKIVLNFAQFAKC